MIYEDDTIVFVDDEGRIGFKKYAFPNDSIKFFEDNENDIKPSNILMNGDSNMEIENNKPSS